VSDPLQELLDRCKLETPGQVHAHVAKTRMLETSLKMLAEEVRSWGYQNQKQESNAQFIGRVMRGLKFLVEHEQTHNKILQKELYNLKTDHAINMLLKEEGFIE
jgi:hypothetical protein